MYVLNFFIIERIWIYTMGHFINHIFFRQTTCISLPTLIKKI